MDTKKNMIKKGQEHWKSMPVLSRKGGYVDSGTINNLIDLIVDDVWNNAESYYCHNNNDINWLRENKRFIKIRAIEQELKMPDSTLIKAVNEVQKLPKKWVEPLNKLIKKIKWGCL